MTPRPSKRKQVADRSMFIRVGGFVATLLAAVVQPDVATEAAAAYGLLVGGDAWVGGKYIDSEGGRPSVETYPGGE